MNATTTIEPTTSFDMNGAIDAMLKKIAEDRKEKARLTNAKLQRDNGQLLKLRQEMRFEIELVQELLLMYKDEILPRLSNFFESLPKKRRIKAQAYGWCPAIRMLDFNLGPSTYGSICLVFETRRLSINLYKRLARIEQDEEEVWGVVTDSELSTESALHRILSDLGKLKTPDGLAKAIAETISG
ncbi:MAG TPA: hypothetical protein VJI33_03465 [Candidatus Paceibacterota bacterium]